MDIIFGKNEFFVSFFVLAILCSDLLIYSHYYSINWVNPVPGKVYPNGTKSGTFKYIYERQVDGSPSSMVYSLERLKDYDYIFPTLINE